MDILIGGNLFVCQFRLLTWTSFILQIIYSVGGQSMGVVLSKPAATITLLEYVKMWCNIQVIIYPVLRVTRTIKHNNGVGRLSKIKHL